MRKSFTLIELLITISLIVALTAVAIYIFRVFLLTWSSQSTREEVSINVESGIGQMARNVRAASQVQSTTNYNEIRFTKDGTTYYIYYLYNENDSYVPPPHFNQSSYQLRKATLQDDPAHGKTGINGIFTYGSGNIILTDVLPPLTSSMSLSANIATIDLTSSRSAETIRSRTEIRPRNL